LEILVGKKKEKILQIQKNGNKKKQLPKNQIHKFQRKKVAPKPHNQHVFFISYLGNSCWDFFFLNSANY
jgi:hypothetical protein